MKVKDFKRANNVRTEEELTELLRRNLHAGRLPVAIASCPKCGEVLDDYSRPCPICGGEK